MSRTSRVSGWPLLLACLVAGGCGREASHVPPSPSKAASTAPERIVVMAPSAAEILDSLDLTDWVVGVGDFVQWPPELARMPKVGSYATPNEEQVLALRTDLVLVTGSQAGKASFAHLRSLGVEVMELKTNTYEGVLTSLRQVGARLGREARAGEVEREIRARMDGIRRRVAGAPKPRVLCVVGQDPLYVAGPGSHIDEMIQAAGGQNVASDALTPFQLVSLEAMLDRQPEVIIDTSDNRPGAPHGREPGAWGQWAFLPAVQRNRVFHVDPARLSIPSPRLPDMTELVGRMIHPEIFGEVSEEELGPLAPQDGSR